jgi:ATP-binding cassette subfamily B protein
MPGPARPRPGAAMSAPAEPRAPGDLRVLMRLWASVWEFRRRVLVALALLVTAKLATVAVPLALKAIIDRLGDPQTLLVLPVFLLLAYALLRFAGTLFGELRDLVFARVTQRIVADLTNRVFAHLLSLGSRFHSKRQTGGLTRDVQRGTAGVGFLLGVGLFTIVPTFVEIAAVLAVMVLNYSHWFTAIILVTFAVYTSFTVAFTQKRAIYQRALNELDSRAGARLVDSLLNYDTVKYFSNESFEARRFQEIMGRSIQAAVDNQKALSMLHVGQSAVIAFGVAAVMLLAGQGVVQQQMTVGDLVLINAYVIQICLPLNALGFVFRQAKDALVNAEKLYELLRQQPEVIELPAAPALAIERGEVRFESVSFGYEPGRQILWDVGLVIAPGATAAIVGGSGSGKSTLARLLFRFYDVSSGRIVIDGQDIRGASLKSLRDAIGIVPQDTVLFNDTIAYNIAYGRNDATLAEVVQAAQAAQLHPFIQMLPEQYDTVVGERGVKLSGGEKQRIAIARAILKNPPILVFDEATSALDMESERAIQAELDRIAENRTTLVIAHRLSTVVGADEIIVLERGRVVERGNHRELLSARGIYARMWSLQQQQTELEETERRLAFQPVNLSAVLGGVLESVRPPMERKGIRLYALRGADSSTVNGDPGELQRVAWELLTHAVEVSPPGGRIELKLERAGACVRLSVADTGGPVAAAPRGPAPDATPETNEVRGIVERHQGKLRVERAADGSGMVRTIELPLRAVMPAEHRPAGVPQFKEAADGPMPTLSGLKIMVIDDQDDARDALQYGLRAHGARVEAVGSAAAALSLLGRLALEEWPNALVCDIAMPDEDGYTFIRRLRLMEADRRIALAQRVPAIALSGYADSEDRTRSLLAGFQMHLAKPVPLDELVAALAGLAARRAAAPA